MVRASGVRQSRSRASCTGGGRSPKRGWKSSAESGDGSGMRSIGRAFRRRSGGATGRLAGFARGYKGLGVSPRRESPSGALKRSARGLASRRNEKSSRRAPLLFFVLVELVVQRLEADPQFLGRDALRAVVLGQHAQDVLHLDLAERL